MAIHDDPKVHLLAEALDIRVAEAVGLVVGVMARMPEHAPDGDLADVPNSLLEKWSGWQGVRGMFAERFVELFLNDGVWSAWEKHNGSAIREANAARERMREYRKNGKKPDNAEFAERSENGTPDHSPNRSPDGQVLRTNERTNERTDKEEAATLAALFADEDHKSAYLAYRRQARMPETFDASLRAVQSGMRGKPLDWPTIGAALIALGSAGATFSEVALLAFAKKLVTTTPAVPAWAGMTWEEEKAARDRGDIF